MVLRRMQEILEPAFKEIREKNFKDEWFLNVDGDRNKMEFGNQEGYYFTLYFISSRYLMISPYKFNTPNDLTLNILYEVEKVFKKENYDILISGKEMIATGDRSEYVKEILEYLSENVFKNRSLRLPLYSAFPIMEWEDAVHLVYDRNDPVEKIRSLIDAKNFHKKEKEELEKMKETEKEIHDMILKHDPNVRIHQDPDFETSPFYFSDLFSIKCSFNKIRKNKMFYFEASCMCGDENKKIKNENLDFVLEEAKMKIKDYLKTS